MNSDVDDQIFHPQKSIHHFCSTCLRAIVDETYIICIFCKGFIQCLECFSSGYEKGTHCKTHPFVLIEPSNENPLEADWSIEEELLFLKAIDNCGFGNWDDVSFNLTTKTPQQCENHYTNIYLQHHQSPSPEIFVHPPLPVSPRPSYSSDSLQSLPSDRLPEILAEKNKTFVTTPAEFCGYMPKRHEFEKEFFDDAENLIKGIRFDENDTQQSIERKLTKLIAFNDQLSQRRIRTTVVEDWNVQYEPDLQFGSKTPTEKEIDQKILPFSPYLKKEATLHIIDTIKNYNRNCERLSKLIFWHKQGITNYDEGYLFNKMAAMVEQNKIPQSNVAEWNKGVDEHERMVKKAVSSDSNILSKKEMKFCQNNHVEYPLYFALKDFLLREFTARGQMTKEQAMKLDVKHSDLLSKMFDLFKQSGWIV